MRGLYYFVVKPIGSRYNNVKKIGDKLISAIIEINISKFV